MCWASNSIGRQDDPCLFHVVPARRPAPVNNCSAANASAGDAALRLRCNAGFGGGLEQVTKIQSVFVEIFKQCSIL